MIDELTNLCHAIAPDLQGQELNIDLAGDVGGSLGLTGPAVRHARGQTSGCAILLNEAAIYRRGGSGWQSLMLDVTLHELSHALADGFWPNSYPNASDLKSLRPIAALACRNALAGM